MPTPSCSTDSRWSRPGVIVLGLALSALVAHDWAIRERVQGAEFHILALTSTAGAVLMTQANDLIVIFLGLEILSIGLYVLVAFDRHRATSAEAALKYFLLGGFASAIFIYGAALVYGATGSTNLSSISYFSGRQRGAASGPALRRWRPVAGGIRLQGRGRALPPLVARRLSGCPDAGHRTHGLDRQGGRVRRLHPGAHLGPRHPARHLAPDLLGPHRLHDAGGRVLALVQRNVKRMLAYSSINHAGLHVAGLWAGTIRGTAATLFYVMTYAPIVDRHVRVLTLVGGVGDENHDIEHYRGLARRQPWLGAALAVLLLSQLGVPLTTGFYAKFAVLAAVVDAGNTTLAVIALLGAAIAAVFYLRWTFTLYADDDLDAARIVVPTMTGLVIGLGVAATVVFGVWPGPLAALAQHATVLFSP
jgi:NADH-quinone oxidoreductase subunit N